MDALQQKREHERQQLAEGVVPPGHFVREVIFYEHHHACEQADRWSQVGKYITNLETENIRLKNELIHRIAERDSARVNKEQHGSRNTNVST